jgi:hypothetical protein
MDPGFELPTGVYTHPFLQETSDITHISALTSALEPRSAKGYNDLPWTLKRLALTEER